MKSIFRTKSITEVIRIADKNSLKKTIGWLDLIFLGIGCTIGTGVFVLTGIAAAKYAGPSISVSYLLAAMVCIFAGLAYTEFASMIPVAGSAYTYSYIVMGEFVAWIVAWCLILEYAFCASTVAAGWSGYFVGILNSAHIFIPEYLTKTPSDGGIINLPSSLISIFVGFLLFRGTKESVIVNRVLVAVKLGTIFVFLLVAAPHIKMENYSEFMPFGWNGVISGAAAIFFAYIGFDSVAGAAEEAKNPNRDLPIGIIGSLIACALLYILSSLAITGITNYQELNNPEPMAYALRQNGSNIGSALIGTGAIVGMVTAMIVMMYGQSRMLFVISRDGLIPKSFSKLHPKFSTPYVSCVAVTIAVSLISGFTPIHIMSRITSLGTLLAFAIVAICVVVLRIKKPDLQRPFKCPAVFIIAPIAIISCTYLIGTILSKTGEVFLVWVLIGLFIYFFYSYKKSPLNFLNV